MDKKIYLLEDDKNIGELVRCALELSGLQVECYETVAAFTEAADRQPPAVALLDIMLPDGNGLDVLARLKQKSPSTGVIMLSALGQETDKVRGLNLGADDYISKPFGVLELAARVNALLDDESSKGAQDADNPNDEGSKTNGSNPNGNDNPSNKFAANENKEVRA